MPASVTSSVGLNDKRVRSEFFGIYSPASESGLWRRVAETMNSDTDIERHRWLGSVPQMAEWREGLRLHGLRAESYDVANKLFATGLQIDRTAVADDQTMQIMKRVRELAQRAAQHPDELLADLLVNGGTAGFNSYDGKTFFATDHESGESGAQDNALELNVVDANEPTTAEMKQAIRNMRSALLSFKDDHGKPMNQTQSGLVLIVPVDLLDIAEEALKATIIENTSNVLANRAEVTFFPYLDLATDMFMAKVDDVNKPFVFQDREPLTTEFLGEGTETYVLDEKMIFKVRARYQMAYGAWQKIVRLRFI